MSGLGIVVMFGVLTGAGIAIMVAGLVPSSPELKTALARLDTGTGITGGPVLARTGGRRTRLVGSITTQLEGRTGPLAVPVQDLAVLGMTTQTYVTRKVAGTLAGVAFPPLLVAVLSLTGWGLPIGIPAIASLLLGAGGWFFIDLEVRGRAEEARRELRRALSAYLDLMALVRVAGGGPTEAIEDAATAADGWAFRRVRAAVARARLDGRPAWDALTELGDTMGVREFRTAAEIMRTSGEGAAVYDTLLAQSESLRGALLAEEATAANAASERMTYPSALTGVILMIALAYPFIARIS